MLKGANPPADPTPAGRGTRSRRTSCGGPNATRFYTRENGWCWFFGATDHCTDEVVGWHMAKKGDRWAALEPIRRGVKRHFRGYAPKIALGLGLPHDWGRSTRPISSSESSGA